MGGEELGLKMFSWKSVHLLRVRLRAIRAGYSAAWVLPSLFLIGCGQQYRIVGESDTNDPIAVSIMKVCPGEEPVRLYYTELTANDTVFSFDERVPESDARVEAWFELRNRPESRTIYSLPPGKKLRVKLDEDDDRVVIEETKIDGDDDLDDD